MKKIYSLLALAISSVGFAQYNGTGNFTLVNNINNLTDGYYVITNETSEFLMTSVVNTSGTNHYYTNDLVTVASGTITNPATANVWKIETTTGGKTIYNETTQKYVGWTSGNSATAETTAGPSNTWTFSLVPATTGSNPSPERFSVMHSVAADRQLSYNASSPRFAAYSNTNQQELQFYKLEVVEEQVPVTATFNAESLTDFTYVENQATSPLQTITVTIADLPIDETATLSLNSTDFTIVSPTELALENGEHTIELKLSEGLTVGEYTANLTVSHNETTLATLTLTGEVTEDETASTTENNIEGLRVFPNPAKELVNITSNEVGTKNVAIYNMLGKKVLETSTEETVNVSTLTSGVYIMKISQDGKNASRKLVIK